MHTFDVAVVGAGPHGLAAVLHLLDADPSMGPRIAVLDPSGRWLSAWHDSFARHEMTTLRSPGVHHPGPDPGGLDNFARRRGLPPGVGPYQLPPVATFAAYCETLAIEAGMADAVRSDTVHDLRVRPDLVVLDTDGGPLAARHLVVATNPRRRILPPWLAGIVPMGAERLAHSDDVDLRGLDLTGETVLIVGGGLTAAHLSLRARQRGADEVHLVARRPLVARTFDVDPGWLGPRELDAYRSQPDWHVRVALARGARGGGSIPPALLDELGRSDVRVHAGARVAQVGRLANRPQLALDNGTDLRPDRVWLATGTVPTVSGCRLLGRLAADLPLCADLPVTDDNLRLGPYPISVMGRLATLRLGPAAGNLWGARQAARLITPALTGTSR